MKTIYVIDACALIDAARNYNMSKKSFSHIWAALDDLIQNGELISSTEIMDELKDDDLKAWAKQQGVLPPAYTGCPSKNNRSADSIPDAD